MKSFNEFTKDLNKTNSDKSIRHDWATHIEHSRLGAFKVESHSLEEDGTIEEYYVIYENREIAVPANEIEVLLTQSHGHSPKKKKK